MHATVGQCDKARAEIPAGLALSRDTGTLERASRALALCGASDALTLSAEVAKRLPEAILVTRVSLPITSALLALSRGEPDRALQLLEPVRPYDLAPAAELWPVYARGQAYLQLKNGDAARKEFEMLLAHRGQIPVSLLYPLAHLGVARAAMLLRDPGTARTSYASMLDLWKDADSNLAPLSDARREQASLHDGGTR
jgi:tetratricopeptide (TPR) repeat protein